MIKGGFQGLDISEVDLTVQSPTLPGGYAACVAADGKTVRVLTADGVVQCSVKKVSTSYVLGGVTGDGKILGITITSTDGITVSETVFTPASGELWDVDTPVDISEYNGSTDAKKYIVPMDGYGYIYANASASGYADLRLFKKLGPASTAHILLRVYGDSAAQLGSVFLKKGSVISVEKTTGATGFTFTFYGLK